MANSLQNTHGSELPDGSPHEGHGIKSSGFCISWRIFVYLGYIWIYFWYIPKWNLPDP